VGIGRLGWRVRVYPNQAKGVVGVWKTRIGHYLRQDTLEGDLLYFLLLGSRRRVTFAFLATAFLGLLSGGGLFRGRLTFTRYRRYKQLDLFTVRRDRVKGEVGRVGEGVLLLHCNSRVFFELMGAKETQNRV